MTIVGKGVAQMYPVSLKLAGKSCLVVGGGPVALHKARELIDCGSRVQKDRIARHDPNERGR